MEDFNYDNAKSLARWACKNYILTADQWEEVYQETALALWKSGATRAWGAARDSARSQLYGKSRTLKYQPKFVAFDAVAYDKSIDMDIDPILIRDLLDKLPVTERDVIQKIYIEDKGWETTSKELGVHDSTVYGRWKRGMHRLKLLLSS